MTPNPFLAVWIDPRRTVRKITNERPGYLTWPLAILSGINNSLHSAVSNSRGAQPPWLIVAVTAVIVGALSGLLSVWLGAYLLRWTGRLMDGSASLRRLRTAMAWAAVPSLVGLLLCIPRFVCFGTSAFTGGPWRHDSSPTDRLLGGVFSRVDLVLAVWSLVLLCNTVAEVQGFRSAWQGLANLLLTGLAVAVPLIILLVALLAAGGKL